MARTHVTLSAAMRARDVSRPRPDRDPPPAEVLPDHADSGPVGGDGGHEGPAHRQRRGSFEPPAGSPQSATGPDRPPAPAAFDP
ncbi:hypothetical protein, partial [Nocardiopsis rhodophaea]|uniref:hypothetical protein n=1 Tax=Nocardiopsis rhodophaea TaxID=280238 RepID=UPI0039EF23BC